MAETGLVTDGRIDGWTDGSFLICLPKFLQGHEKKLSDRDLIFDPFADYGPIPDQF